MEYNNNNMLSIVFGGMSPEHPASLESFRYVYESICETTNSLRIITIYYVDRENSVYMSKFDRNMQANEYVRKGKFISYYQMLDNMLSEDVYVLNLLHGNFGEDGHIQGAAAVTSLRGSFGPVLPSSLAMSKSHMNHYISSAHPSLRIPKSLTIKDKDKDTAIKMIMQNFEGETIVVKPNSLGASLFTEKYFVSEAIFPDLKENLRKIFEYDQNALIQSFIKGTEYSVGCIQVGMKPTSLPVVEIRTNRQFFGHNEKHKLGMVEEVIVEPDTLTTQALRDISTQIFDDLGFANMCRVDYIVSENGDPYFIEVNPIPGLMRNSIFPKMLLQGGLTIPDLISQFITNSYQISDKNMHFDYQID